MSKTYYLDLYQQICQERGQAKVMEDGASIHRAAIAKKWKEEHGIINLSHPASPSDLNSIEGVWADIKRRVSAKTIQPKNVHDLCIAIQEE